MTREEAEPAEECGRPCSPESPCDECAEYWQRMEREGLWDKAQHRWSEKGWKEMGK